VHLSNIAHAVDSRGVRHQRQASQASGAREPELACDPRVEAVGAHDEPRRKPRWTAAGAEPKLPHAVALGRHGLHQYPLPQLGALGNGGVGETGVQHGATNTEPHVAVATKSVRAAEPAGERRPTMAHDRHAREQCRLGAERAEHPEPVENPQRLRAHVFGAGLVTGEPGSVEQHHAEPAFGQ